ncbi:MAG: hypothetical protein CME26_11670 [Gemmatimonadetes bacterium]|nr:hypothetical protein [Gemmatimonadota bacterium]
MEGDTARHALTLPSAPGLGPSSYRALISHFGSPESVLEAPFDALCAVEGIGLETAQAIRSQVDSDWASRQLDACKRLQVQLLHLSGPGYPHLLRQTYAPPPSCSFSAIPPSLSVPRSPSSALERNSPYGKDSARQLAGGLARAGVVVVSGLALGIDGHAHRRALAASGGTVAVLGSGLDRPTPPSHRPSTTRSF